jgi:hypothetical protein
MDYAFAPGGTGFDKIVAKYLRLRPQTQVLTPATNDVAAFISMVNTDASVQRPIGQLGIGCHGHPYGILQIQLDPSANKQSAINDVTRVEASHALELPLTTLFPRPINPATSLPIIPVFRIVGCSVGAARPFLTHLRKALGDKVLIVATQHTDMEFAPYIGALEGVFRTLIYDFRINAPTVIEGQEGVVDAFDNKNFKFIDGKPIPRSFWKARIPTDPFNTTKVENDANVTFDPKINGVKTLPLPLNRFEFIWEPVGPWRVGKPTGPVQSTTQRREFMRGQIKTRPEFAAGHPYPLHEQRGYATYDAFIDGYDWLESTKLPDHWTGYRCVYVVGAPINLDSDDDEVPYDWVDTTNTATHFGLNEFDSRLFVNIP